MKQHQVHERDCDIEGLEDLALDRLDAARAAIVRAHLGLCSACRAAYELFAEERELFVRRAAIVGGGPNLAASLEGRVATAIADEVRARRSRRAGAVRAVLALVACSTAFVGTSWLDRGVGPADRHASSREPSASVSGVDEPLACALPVSGFVHVSDRAVSCAVSDRAASLVEGRALCEDVVTSSVATP